MKMKSMTVRELRLALFNVEDQDAPVYFACDYGDHSHTTQVLRIRSVNEHDEHQLVKTAYSSSGYALDEDQGGLDGDTVVVLS